MTKQYKTALVTGGAIRVGAKIARFLHAKGYKVFITYNNSKDQAQALKNEGIASEIFKIDFSKETSLREAHSATRQSQEILGNVLYFSKNSEVMSSIGLQPNPSRNDASLTEVAVPRLLEDDMYGKIDLLINNASIFEREEILDQALLQKNINIHLMQPIILADMLFHQTGNSHIINILDQMDSNIGKNFISYHLTKKLLEETTKLHAKLYHPKIRVNAIAPRVLMRNERQSEEHFQNMASKLDIDPIDILLKDILFLEESSLTGKIIYEK